MSDSEFDSFATDYQELHRRNISLSGEEPSYFAEYKMRDFMSLVTEAGLSTNGRYLDFGSGIGTSISHFRKLMPKAQLVCADVSSESLELSNQYHGDSVDYAWIPNDELPFNSAQFDGVFACCVFHHIPQERHQQSLSELRRVLKPGGLLMVYEHNPYNPLTVRSVRNCPFDENAVLLTASQLQRNCSIAGLECYRLDYRVFFPAMLARLRPLENWLRWLPLGAQYFVAARRD